jgi:hypothetical protein
MMAPSEITRDLNRLEAELKRLETEYNMFFAGELTRPPLETRARVEAMVKKLDRTFMSNHGERFRFSTLQARVATFFTLWERTMRAREEGRSGASGRNASRPFRSKDEG